MFKQFAIFKNDKATGNQPPYRMVVKDEQGKSHEVAGLWVKESNGNKFYSGKFREKFQKDDGTTYDGYSLISDTEYQSLNAPQKPQNDAQQTENDDIDPADIPF